MDTVYNHIYNIDTNEGLNLLDKESVDMCVTSPPYYGLRNYGNGNNQLGLENHPVAYVKHLCDVFDKVKYVLKKTGTCWVNIGDTYSCKPVGNFTGGGKEFVRRNTTGIEQSGVMDKTKTGIREKSLIMIPFRFAIEMTNRGWILRNTIIWHKPNCMPCSVKDRFTVDFEYLFFFSKNKKYHFEQQFEPYKIDSLKRACRAKHAKGSAYSIQTERQHTGYKNMQERAQKGEIDSVQPDGRNMRTVWTISTKPFKGAHFAVFPEKLIETPIRAGCPEYICKKCGKARTKIIERLKAPLEVFTNTTKPPEAMRLSGKEIKGCGQKLQNWREEHPQKIVGLTDCGCNAGFEPGIVLDPFIGSGTTAVVCKKLGCKYIGFEINKEYCKIAKNRIEELDS